MENNVVRKIFNYNGSDVTFASKGDVRMINATQMAKPFGDSKRAKNWLSLKSTIEFLSVLSEGKNLPSSELVKVTYGNNGSTWMHEDVALEFARWLSPAFAIWCNDRIKELMKYGITATETTIDSIIADPDNGIRLLTALKQEREQRQLAEQKADALQKINEEQKPKVVFADAVIGSENNILIRDLAKLICQNGYEIGEIRLYRWLRDHKYLTLENKPMQRYVEQGLFYIEEGTHTEKGVMKSHTVTKVTGKGQNYFINKFLAQ